MASLVGFQKGRAQLEKIASLVREWGQASCKHRLVSNFVSRKKRSFILISGKTLVIV